MKFISKAFELQSSYLTATGRCRFDVTCDLEDGAAIGDEQRFRAEVVEVLASPANRYGQAGVRIHSVHDGDLWRDDLSSLFPAVNGKISHLTLPKVATLDDIRAVVAALTGSRAAVPPLHVLIETPEAVRNAWQIAAHPNVRTLEFGIMDFISEHGGGIPAQAMRSPGQFENELITATKVEICSAALGNGKIPVHNVCVDVRSVDQCRQDALRARTNYGFLRMWSIHPSQIPIIIEAFAADPVEISEGKEILRRAEAAGWGPIEFRGRLHDRASFRYYANIVGRAEQ